MSLPEEIKAKYSCRSVLQAHGITIVNSPGKDDRCLCPFHKDGKPSLEITKNGKDLWVCRAGCGGGDVIDLLARFEDKTAKQWLSEQNRKAQGSEAFRVRPTAKTPIKGKPEVDPFEEPKSEPAEKSVLTHSYDYHDENGKLVYQALRYEPKTFRQRRVLDNGEFAWNMEGVIRYPYRLTEVRKEQHIWIVEGEKDADGLRALGMTATCNVGGAGKWLESYSGYFEGKDVVLCGDNDAPGQKHMDDIQEKLMPNCKSIRRVRVPLPAKDISEYTEGLSDGEASDLITTLWNSVPPLFRGETLPLKTMAQMEEAYIESRRLNNARVLRLGRWLPSMSGFDMVPGDMIVLVSETGVGKTAILSNVSLIDNNLTTLFFEQELAETKLYERTIQTIGAASRNKVREIYDSSGRISWSHNEAVKKTYFCTESRMSLERLESIIKRSELLSGKKPDLVVLDYLQLMRPEKKQTGRYDMFSDLAEGIKMLAKACDVIIFCACQANRDKEREYGCLQTTDAKDSGSIENSCGLMLGASRNPEIPDEMCIQVLKSTEHGGGLRIKCNYLLDTLKITEKELWRY